MFLLILFISLSMAILCIPFLLSEKWNVKVVFLRGAGAIIPSVGLWMLYYFFLYGFMAHFSIGLVFLVFAFSRIGIYPLPQHFTSGGGIATVHLLLMAVISAMSGLPAAESLLVLLLFIPFTLIGVLLFQKAFHRYRRKKVENVKLLLELFCVLDGIFVFIITLIITSDRIRFLEKIANQLF